MNSARVEALHGDPNQPGTLYVAFGSGNLWKTTNNGLTWKPIFENQPTLGIGDIALAPSNSKIIYLGTGESLRKNRNFTMPGTGIYRSDDGGETWTVQYSDPLGSGEDDAAPVEEELDDYAMDDLYGDPYGDDAYGDEGDDLYGDSAAMAPVDTSGAPLLDVFCDSRDRAVAVGGYGYFLRTTDGGETWNKALDSLDNRDGWHLYDYAAAKGGNDRYVVGEKGVMFHSADKGVSWEKLQSPYSGTLFGVTAISDYKALTYGLQGNVWLTANRGRSWAKIPSKLSRGVNDGTVLADGTVVLVTNAGGILTSHDGGQSFSLRFLPDRDSISAVLPRDAGGILVAGQGGLRVIEDVK